MKFNTNKLLAVLAVASLGVACNKEQLQDEIPSSGNGTVQVVVSLDNSSKSFTDAEGVKWEVGDQIKYAGGVELTSAALTAEDITDNGYKATFTFDSKLTEADRTGWFVSTKCHPGNYTEVEFTLGADNGNVFTQDVAGEMNKRYLFLHSGTGTINITKDVPPEVKMEIAGTIFRVIPYTQTYNDEKILSVKLSSNTEMVGTVEYNRGAGTYRGVNSVNWKKYNFVKATLGTAFPLVGVTSAETSKGIYLAVAATPADAPLYGYKYEIETDKANYVFSAMDKTLAVGNNAVKNVFLNLDKAERVAESGLLKYGGALNLTSIPAAGCTDQDAGYWEASTSTDGGTTWTKRINSENSAFYSNVQFSYADAKTGEPVDWISVVYGGGDLCHWRVTALENTGEERSVKVTATFSDVKGYQVIETSKTKELTITQAAAGSNKKLTFFGGIGDATIDATGVVNKSLGYCVIDVSGTHAEDWSGNSHNEAELYGNVTITPYVLGTGVGAGATVADWLTVGYGKDSEGKFNTTHILVTAQDNTGAERKSLVYCEYIAPEGYEFEGGAKSVFRQFIITQKAAELQVEADFSGFSTEAVSDAGGTVTGSLSLKINGETPSDVAAALTTYGLSLSANKGATASVAADGTVTVVIPSNPYNNGGITYTVSLKKNDGTVAASAEISQATGEGEVVTPSHTFGYTIFNDKPDGSKDTGFGSAAGSVGNYYRIENVSIDGTKYNPGDDLRKLVADTELMAELTAKIFSFGEITSEDVQVPGSDPLTTNPESFVELQAWTDGGAAIYFRIVFLNANTTGARRTFKIITKDPEGAVTSTVVYFQNS